MVDNIHRTCEVEWKALMALAKRASENTFTLDPTFKVNTSNESGPAEDAVPDSYPTTKRFIVDHVLALQNVMATNIITLEHNYRLSQLPLVGANFIAGDVEAVKEGMPTPSGTIGLTSFADSREAAISIATQIEELRIRGAQYAEIGILYADGFMQKTLPSVLREKNIPFESGLGDYLGAFSGAAWLVRVLRFSLSPVNSASGADAVYDRKFGDVAYVEAIAVICIKVSGNVFHRAQCFFRKCAGLLLTPMKLKTHLRPNRQNLEQVFLQGLKLLGLRLTLT